MQTGYIIETALLHLMIADAGIVVVYSKVVLQKVNLVADDADGLVVDKVVVSVAVFHKSVVVIFLVSLISYRTGRNK